MRKNPQKYRRGPQGPAQRSKPPSGHNQHHNPRPR
nr:MAG TPA: hypothetical protein [Caudoviricetes sp.]